MRKQLLRTTLTALMVAGLCIVISGCGASEDSAQHETQGRTPVQTQEIKASPDKHIWYAKDYRGMNLANVGYVSLAGDLRDSYGAANIKLIPICVDGTYVDASDQDALKEFVVIDQNVNPNTEMTLVFGLDEKGEEYDNLVSYSSIEDFVLLVEKIGGSDKKSIEIPMTEIVPSPDAETRYAKDYVGRNLASLDTCQWQETFETSTVRAT